MVRAGLPEPVVCEKSIQACFSLPTFVVGRFIAFDERASTAKILCPSAIHGEGSNSSYHRRREEAKMCNGAEAEHQCQAIAFPAWAPSVGDLFKGVIEGQRIHLLPAFDRHQGSA